MDVDGHTGKSLCGRYRLDGLLGAGGMGTVYAGTHLRLDRPVAVKLLKPEVGRDSTLVERFFREARTAAGVNSVGIVDVLDLDVDPALGPFMVMERLHGEGLEDLLPRGPLPPARSAQIIADMLDVLGAVHAKGVVHRDLKPPNVFLHRTEDGKEIVKVLDFGIAQLSFARMTIEGAVIGTPRWMAPEQAKGRPDVDHRADLYAAGLLLYSCLSGQPPYADVPARDIARYIDHGPTPLRTLAPAVPEAMHQLVDRALAPDPTGRFQSAAEMAAALRTVDLSSTSSPEISATRVSPAPGVQLPAPRPLGSRQLGESSRRLGIAIVLGVMVAGVVVGTVAYVLTDEEAPVVRPNVEGLIFNTCPLPTGELVGLGADDRTMVWSSGGIALRVTAQPGQRGNIPLYEPGTLIEIGTYTTAPCVENVMFCGAMTIHDFDPSRRHAHIELSQVTLHRADGQTCMLSADVRSHWSPSR